MATYSKFVCFMGWRDHFMKQPSEEHIVELYHHPYVINYQDLKWIKQGKVCT